MHDPDTNPLNIYNQIALPDIESHSLMFYL
jgi:hypothetical protein